MGKAWGTVGGWKEAFEVAWFQSCHLVNGFPSCVWSLEEDSTEECDGVPRPVEEIGNK